MDYEIDKNYKALKRLGRWDLESKKVIQERISRETGKPPVFSFLTQEEGSLLETIISELIIQDESSDRVFIAQSIDKELSFKKQGTRYGNVPWRGEFYKTGLAEIKKIFIPDREKDDFNQKEMKIIIRAIIETRENNFLKSFVKKILNDSLEIYYSHPSSWNQIGFPGPAYPEGYAYLGCDEADEWEPKYYMDDRQKFCGKYISPNNRK